MAATDAHATVEELLAEVFLCGPNPIYSHTLLNDDDDVDVDDDNNNNNNNN
jgi:hypothetical protein